MKRKLIAKSLLCGLIISFLLSMTSFDARSGKLSDEVLRLHIMANSDSEKDQSLKLLVRDEILGQCKDLFKNSKTKEEAETIVKKNLPRIKKTAAKVIAEHGLNYDVNAEIVNMYFTNRVYGSITMPAGNYDALRITIGQGGGHNWWCVMFPPICIAAADASDVLSDDERELLCDEKYKYKFKIYEVYQNLVNKIGG